MNKLPIDLGFRTDAAEALQTGWAVPRPVVRMVDERFAGAGVSPGCPDAVVYWQRRKTGRCLLAAGSTESPTEFPDASPKVPIERHGRFSPK
jgi:hypothetical protein